MILEDQATTSTLMPPAQGKFRTRRILSIGYLLTCASAPVGACLSLLDRQDVRTQYDILSVLPLACPGSTSSEVEAIGMILAPRKSCGTSLGSGVARIAREGLGLAQRVMGRAERE